MLTPSPESLEEARKLMMNLGFDPGCNWQREVIEAALDRRAERARREGMLEAANIARQFRHQIPPLLIGAVCVEIEAAIEPYRIGPAILSSPAPGGDTL